MWPLAECTNSLLVRTPSLQLGVLQITMRFIPDSFDFFLSPCRPIPLVETRAKLSPVRHQVTTAQVGHKGVNPFTPGPSTENFPPHTTGGAKAAASGTKTSKKFGTKSSKKTSGQPRARGQYRCGSCGSTTHIGTLSLHGVSY